VEGALIALIVEENFAPCHAERKKSGRLRPLFWSRSTPMIGTVLRWF